MALGLWLGTTVQLVPSQCSVSVAPIPPVTSSNPVAQMSVESMPATPNSELTTQPGFGPVAVLQLLPSQFSNSVWNP